MTGLTTLTLQDAPDPGGLWKSLVESCPDAWFWHSWVNMEFNFVAAQKNGVQNLSFFVLLDGKPVGLVPLMVERTTIGKDFQAWDAAYYGGPLPWPIFHAGLPEPQSVEQYAFQELERVARESHAGRIRVRLSPPAPLGNEQQRLARAIQAHSFVDASYTSHSLMVQPDTLANVRERYRRYVKKFMPQYEMSVKEGEAVSPDVEENYFRLHVKDAGGQFRSRESYTYQSNLAREREAFYIVATRRRDQAVAGMLLVSVHKSAAYDNSVAVDPDFQEEYVSHLMKWAAIENLIALGVQSYELGQKAMPPTTTSIPSSKNYGISHFKEGWSKGSVKTVAVAEKFLNAGFLDAVTFAQRDAAKAYFGLS